jgi:hypothetical protein
MTQPLRRLDQPGADGRDALSAGRISDEATPLTAPSRGG